MSQSSGHPPIVIGILDGPVASHLDLCGLGPECETPSTASAHAAMVAGVLAARREGAAPGICPSCRLVVRPIFDRAGVPNTDPAIVAPSSVGNDRLRLALDYASTRGAIVIAAAGNYDRNTGSPLISRHSVVPVASCDEPDGRCPVRTSGHRSGGATCLRPLRYQSQ
ncbi:hypothetical protein [Mycobacterium sp.]|uniref:hypothetical protein n=1 Tax=Mycobacterium sp. TaxID=1785 RepID=UPI003C708240